MSNRTVGIPRQGGFTLLEMVIAITLLGVMMTLAYGALRVGNRSWSAVAKVHEATEELRVGYRFLRRELGQALPPRPELDESSRPLFEGKARTLSFVAPLPVRAAGSGGPYRFSLGFDESEEKTRLVLDYQVYSGDDSDHTEAERVVLVEGASSGGFGYFGVVDAGEQAAWHDTWDRTDALPSLVRLNPGRDQESAVWPELVVPLRNADG